MRTVPAGNYDGTEATAISLASYLSINTDKLTPESDETITLTLQNPSSGALQIADEASCGTAISSTVYTITDLPGVTLSGTIFNDNNAGTPDGNPLAGTTVTLYASDGTTVLETTTTDANGNYSSLNVPPGNFVVGVTPPSGYQNVGSTDATTPRDGLTSIAVAMTAVPGTNFGLNQPPITTNDVVANQVISQPATVPNILNNDSDPNGGTLNPANISLVPPVGATAVVTDAQGDVTGFTVPGQGTWILNTDGSITFTPQSGFQSDPTPINYTVKNEAGLASNPSTITITVTPLPVTLVNFSVSKKENTTILSWVTTVETNSDRFEIQHSLSGKDWNLIGTVKSNGESSVKKVYTFAHISPASGENLYRLKMIDKDVTFAYSRIQSVKFDGVGSDLSVYPNPVNDKLFMPDFNHITQVKINHLNGRCVYQAAGSLTGEVDVKNLSAGIYIVNITRSNGIKSSQKIVISK